MDIKELQEIPWVYNNFDTGMGSEVNYVPVHFRTDSDHRYKVVFSDLDSDNVVSVRFFFDFDEAIAYAEELAFPTGGGLIDGPICVPPIR